MVRIHTVITHDICCLWCLLLPTFLLLPFLTPSLGARVEVEDKEGNTALHIAARHGHASVVKTLVSNGANMLK